MFFRSTILVSRKLGLRLASPVEKPRQQQGHTSRLPEDSRRPAVDKPGGKRHSCFSSPWPRQGALHLREMLEVVASAGARCCRSSAASKGVLAEARSSFRLPPDLVTFTAAAGACEASARLSLSVEGRAAHPMLTLLARIPPHVCCDSDKTAETMTLATHRWYRFVLYAHVTGSVQESTPHHGMWCQAARHWQQAVALLGGRSLRVRFWELWPLGIGVEGPARCS